MSIIESILDSVALQQLQLCLAFWQIVKSTPVGGFIKGIIACLLLPLIRLLQPFGLSPTIARLQCFHGRLFKRVRCHVIRAPEPMAPPACRQIDDQLNKLPSQYLGKKIRSREKRRKQAVGQWDNVLLHNRCHLGLSPGHGSKSPLYSVSQLL